jgi:uracil phosphoribosyltransferase
MWVLAEQNSLAKNFLCELRDEEKQKDTMRFRRNLERIGEIFAYEISKTLSFKNTKINTSLGVKETQELREYPIIATVLRAAMPLHQGLLNFFDKSESSFIGVYRGVHDKKEHFEIEMDYISSPSLQGKTLIICDPMLATGKSLEKAYHALLRFGIPDKTHIISVVASQRGVRYIKARMPECKLWIGDIDDELNTKSYIVPGLGDAGDLAFGVKI